MRTEPIMLPTAIRPQSQQGVCYVCGQWSGRLRRVCLHSSQNMLICWVCEACDVRTTEHESGGVDTTEHDPNDIGTTEHDPLRTTASR